MHFVVMLRYRYDLTLRAASCLGVDRTLCLSVFLLQNVLQRELMNMWDFFDHASTRVPLNPSMRVTGLDIKVCVSPQINPHTHTSSVKLSVITQCDTCELFCISVVLVFLIECISTSTCVQKYWPEGRIHLHNVQSKSHHVALRSVMYSFVVGRHAQLVCVTVAVVAVAVMNRLSRRSALIGLL